MTQKLNNDGSMAGKTFSGDAYTGEHPTPKEGETYKEYHDRVVAAKEEGFHLGDLSWNDWHIYCDGYGQNGIDTNTVIE